MAAGEEPPSIVLSVLQPRSGDDAVSFIMPEFGGLAHHGLVCGFTGLRLTDI